VSGRSEWERSRRGVGGVEWEEESGSGVGGSGRRGWKEESETRAATSVRLALL
jgi:hypothetical protein